MTPITRIEITNFQSHAHTVIEPAGSGQLTVITGATDSGKSGVFRALRWLYYGGPCYPRIGCTHTAVSVASADGTIVTRERQGKTNRYVIERPGQEPMVFEGFGREIPLEVQEVLGIRPVVVAGEALEVNLARQHDPAFLGSGISAPARARILGHIAGIEAVDLAVRSASRDIVGGQQEANRLDREIAELEEQVRQYDYLPALGKRIERLEALREAILRSEERRQRLAGVRARLAQLAEEEEHWRSVQQRTAEAVQAATLVEEAQASASRLHALRALRGRLNTLDLQEDATHRSLAATAGAAKASHLSFHADDLHRTLTRLQYLRGQLAGLAASRHKLAERLETTRRAAGADKPIRTLEDRLGRLKRLTWIRSSLADLRQQEQQARGSLELAAAEAERARELYVSTLQDAGRCPVCGSPAHEEHIREVV